MKINDKICYYFLKWLIKLSICKLRQNIIVNVGVLVLCILGGPCRWASPQRHAAIHYTCAGHFVESDVKHSFPALFSLFIMPLIITKEADTATRGTEN